MAAQTAGHGERKRRMGGQSLLFITVVTVIVLILCVVQVAVVMQAGVTCLTRHLPWYLFAVASDSPWAFEVWHGGELDADGAMKTQRLEPEMIGISCREVNKLLENYASSFKTQQVGLVNAAFKERLEARGLIVVGLHDLSGLSVAIRVLFWLLLAEMLAFLWRWIDHRRTGAAVL